MKRILISLFLCFQNLIASVQEYRLDDIRVIVCDEFFLPVAKVGVFYHIGLNQLRNVCEAAVIREKLPSKNMKIAAKNLGVQFSINVYNDFSEISATLSNDQIVDIIKIMLTNEFDINNLELTKDKLKISHKLSAYFGTNITDNQIFSMIDRKHIFNASILDSFTETDLKNVFDIYKKAPKTIVICGRLDIENLQKKLHLVKASFEKENAQQFSDFAKKNIEIRSKFLGRSLYYIYQIKNLDIMKNQAAVLAVISSEMFNYFKKYSQIIDGYDFTNLSRPNFLMLGVKVRPDISKRFFESSLKTFFNHLKKGNISEEKLELISKAEKFSEVDVSEDIHAKYQQLINRYIFYTQSSGDLSEEILKISSEDIKNFVEHVFESNVIARISTQYKAES